MRPRIQALSRSNSALNRLRANRIRHRSRRFPKPETNHALPSHRGAFVRLILAGKTSGQLTDKMLLRSLL